MELTIGIGILKINFKDKSNIFLDYKCIEGLKCIKTKFNTMERFCNFEGYLFIHLNPFSKMLYEGVLRKMLTEFADPIEYYLNLDNAYINVNQLLDKTISISFLRYECLNCALQKKIFRQGFCYDCFMSLPQTADWIINPELSKAHLGIEERDLEYEKMVQLQPHVVYLANSSSVKVGVTRKS